ncbi:hypothetical protein JVU11DRAFT_6486 [Chiua virens]|nr:hypothetical protein JVU11DRAFT_6486 [Chiua virens]
MHPALLIDEILQLIFDFILEVGKPSLCCATRTSKAWKDPALDRIWRRLPSAVPLLSLLPGFSMEGGDIVRFSVPVHWVDTYWIYLQRLGSIIDGVAFTNFHSYAIRVKYIVHRHRILTDSENILAPLFQQMYNLESARIKGRASGDVALRMTLAPRLRALALHVGYTKSNSPSMATMHSMLSLLKGCPLEQLSVRGHSSECLHIPLGSITTLRSLSLHLSSLTEHSLMTVSTLPLLVDFDVHADRLSYDYLSPAISRTCHNPFFPALEKLKIRAQPALAALILQQLPRNKLCSVHIDAIGPCPPSSFADLFDAVSTLPLYEFTVEQTISFDELEDVPTDKFFTLDHLRSLSKLPLRRLILDSSLPPDLADPDIEEITKWWPLLERLELGARIALEYVEATWKPRISLQSLPTLAKGCKHLKHLVIILDIDSLVPYVGLNPTSYASHPLTSLTLCSRSCPDVPWLSTLLSILFPSLVDVSPGSVCECDASWVDLRAAVVDVPRDGP